MLVLYHLVLSIGNVLVIIGFLPASQTKIFPLGNSKISVGDKTGSVLVCQLLPVTLPSLSRLVVFSFFSLVPKAFDKLVANSLSLVLINIINSQLS